jgi:predicted Zn-dependent protease
VLNLAISLGVAGIIAFFLKGPLGVSLWFALLMGLVAGTGLFIYLNKRVQNKFEAISVRFSEQIKRQQFDAAIEGMKEGYKLAPWQFFAKAIVDGQIGYLQYVRNKHAEAEPLLKSAHMKHYVAKAMLAILQWKRGEKGTAKKTFEMALRAGKKESLLYAVYAYVLNEMHEKDAAIDILNQALKKYCKNDDRLISNRTLLQNKKPMKMKAYGEQWYQFLLERPMIRQEPPPFARVSKRMMRG